MGIGPNNASLMTSPNATPIIAAGIKDTVSATSTARPMESRPTRPLDSDVTRRRKTKSTATMAPN